MLSLRWREACGGCASEGDHGKAGAGVVLDVTLNESEAATVNNAIPDRKTLFCSAFTSVSRKSGTVFIVFIFR